MICAPFLPPRDQYDMSALFKRSLNACNSTKMKHVLCVCLRTHVKPLTNDTLHIIHLDKFRNKKSDFFKKKSDLLL